MAHAFACRSGHARDETHDRLLHVQLAPTGGFRLVWATDFANHDDGIGVRVVIKEPHNINVLQTVDGVATNAHSAGLTQADFGQLCHRFVGQCAGATDHTNAAFAVNVTWHDADFDFIRRDQTWAVRTE